MPLFVYNDFRIQFLYIILAILPVRSGLGWGTSSRLWVSSFHDVHILPYTALSSSKNWYFVTEIQCAVHYWRVSITMVHDVLWSLYFHHITCWSFYFAGNTHYKFIRRCYIFLSDNKSFTSHESHKDCIAKGSQLSALPPTRNERRLRRLPVYRHKGVQLAAYCSRMASTSVASALREIREICVKIKCL